MGQVTDTHGEPIAAARIAVRDAEAATASNVEGRFELAGVEPPLVLEVSHPFFGSVAVAVDRNEQVQVKPHPNRLSTQVREASGSERVENRSDWGARWERAFRLGARAEGRFGTDVTGRQGVDALEWRRSAAGEQSFAQTLTGASEEDLARWVSKTAPSRVASGWRSPVGSNSEL